MAALPAGGLPVHASAEAGRSADNVRMSKARYCFHVLAGHLSAPHVSVATLPAEWRLPMLPLLLMKLPCNLLCLLTVL